MELCELAANLPVLPREVLDVLRFSPLLPPRAVLRAHPFLECPLFCGVRMVRIRRLMPFQIASLPQDGAFRFNGGDSGDRWNAQGEE